MKNPPTHTTRRTEGHSRPAAGITSIIINKLFLYYVSYDSLGQGSLHYDNAPAIPVMTRDSMLFNDFSHSDGGMTRSDSDFYEILNLKFTDAPPPPSKQQIKLAYHRALLTHHPDKTSASTDERTDRSPLDTRNKGRSRLFTVDEITTAYKTLSDPLLRAEYDRSLHINSISRENGVVFRTGLEIVDLEDLNCQEETEENGKGQGDPEISSTFWYRSCRCGDERGFVVTEDELEREADHGEIVIECRGCSLWVKVLFTVKEDGNDQDIRHI